MIVPAQVNPALLPSVRLESRKQLPENPCIYFAIDPQNTIQYIGRSVNPRQRWQSHHRFKQLNQMGGVKIAYLDVSDPELLPEIEEALIQHFSPILNGRNPMRKVDAFPGRSRPSRISDEVRKQLFAAIETPDDGRVDRAIALLIARYISFLNSSAPKTTHPRQL